MPLGVHTLVGQNQRDVVVSRWQPQHTLAWILDQEEPSDAPLGLLCGKPVRVGVVPTGGRTLKNPETYVVGLSGPNLVPRVPIHAFRSDESVPVQDERLVKLVLDARCEFLSPPHPNRWPGDRSVDRQDFRC